MIDYPSADLRDIMAEIILAVPPVPASHPAAADPLTTINKVAEALASVFGPIVWTAEALTLAHEDLEDHGLAVQTAVLEYWDRQGIQP
jgi:flavorubredoxin